MKSISGPFNDLIVFDMARTSLQIDSVTTIKLLNDVVFNEIALYLVVMRHYINQLNSISFVLEHIILADLNALHVDIHNSKEAAIRIVVLVASYPQRRVKAFRMLWFDCWRLQNS